MGIAEDQHSAETAALLPTVERSAAPARTPKRHASLLIYHRDGVEVVPLTAGARVVVGREPPADIVLADRCLSRRHAEFTLVSSDAVKVHDLGSRNGTSIAGAKIEQ